MLKAYDSHLAKLYQDVIEQLYPQLKNENCGVLYQSIHLILSKNRQEANLICRHLDIAEDEYLQYDYKLFSVIVSNPQDNIVFRGLKQLFNQENNEDKEMKNWIILTACILVGVSACIKFVEDSKKRQRKEIVRDNIRPPEPSRIVNSAPPLKSITVALCLVVPAYIASNIKNQPQVNTAEIEQLIDNSSYFLCTKCDEANSIQESLEFTKEDILNISEQQEVYIRIDIADAQGMLDKMSTYILKRNIPSNSQGHIKQIASLKNLSGLEKFNRI